MELTIFLVYYIVGCFVCYEAAEYREIGGKRAFWYAILFSPVVSIILVHLTPKDKAAEMDAKLRAGKIEDTEYFRQKRAERERM